MNHCLTNESFLRSLSLLERASIISDLDNNKITPFVDDSIAAEHYQEWQSLPYFDDNLWKQKCFEAGYSQEIVRAALGLQASIFDQASVVNKVQPLHWDFPSEEILSESESLISDILLPSTSEAEVSPVKAFHSLIQPTIEKAHREILDHLQTIQHEKNGAFVDTDRLLLVIHHYLTLRLHRIVERSVVLELNIARLNGQLSGNSSKERFLSFLRLLGSNTYVDRLWQQYPVMARSLIKTGSQWTEATSSLLTHLTADYTAIRETFFEGRDPGKVVDFDFGKGDSHRRGRSVVVLTFSSGDRLVYKPRSLSIDVHFYQFIRWLNQKLDLIQLRTLKVLDCDNHGWMEFVQTEACNSLEQIQRFFERQGAYLAILYLLGATDIHRENLIASGEHPVVVDLETLFHPRLSVAQTSEDPNIQACIEALSDSVLQTGLLPVPLTIDREIDLSGICGSPDQVTPYKVLQWRAAASDEWSYVRDHTQLGESEHSPCIKGEEIQVQDYTPFIVSGFAVVYRKFLQYQDTLLEEIGPLTPFAKDTIRVVVRATQVYGVLLQESYHPDVLRDGIARDQLFDQLWAPCAWGQSFSKVVTAEQQDLWNNDIPIFTSSPLSKDLWTSRGERIENFLPEASMRSVMRRLTSLGESDLAKQCWIIETALWSNVTQSRLDGSIASETEPSIFAMANEWHPRKDEVLIDTAVQLGKRLMKLAIRSQDSTTWLTLAIGNSSQWRIVPCGIDLYSGVSGISLFLAYLTAVTGDSCYRELAQLAVQPLLKKNETFEQSFSGIGLFTGLGGVIYTLTHLSVLWNEERLLEKAVQYASQVEQLVDGDQDFDLIDGAAGCIMGLLPLYRITNSPRILDLLIHCGERLVSSAIPQACGVGWLIRLEPSHALSGISHGVAGIALALLELWAITNIDKMKDTAIRALEYERSLFSPAYGNWPDLRRNREDLIHQSRSKFMDSWCHGAPGIGMARIGIFERCPSEEVRQEIEVAIGTTLREGFGGNHCLCHGDLGNIDLLLLARDRLGMNELNGRIDLLSMVLTRSLRKGIACGVPIRAQPTGLMLGIAGIGFGLLRLNNSKSVPSVLLAEPPIV